MLVTLPLLASANTNQQLLQKLGGPYNAVPEAQTEVTSLLTELLRKSGNPAANVSISILNNAALEAYSFGNFASGTIILNRGLLAAIVDTQQLEAAIAHELAHLQRGDRGGHRRLIVERRSDALAIKWLGSSSGLRTLLNILQANTQMDSTEQHLAERQQYLISGRYTPRPLAPAIRNLQTQEKYYQRYQQALAALAAGADVSAEAKDLTEALPTEAKFWLLLDRSLSSQSPCGYAAVAADENPNWFLPWLVLGECQMQQGIDASDALQASIALLPTEKATQLLATQRD